VVLLRKSIPQNHNLQTAVEHNVMRLRELMNNFEMREDENGIGKVLILKGAWSDDIAAYMKRQRQGQPYLFVFFSTFN